MRSLVEAAAADSDARRAAQLDELAGVGRRSTCLGCPKSIVQPTKGGRPRKYCGLNCRMKYLRANRPERPCLNCLARVDATRELVSALQARIIELEGVLEKSLEDILG